MKTQLNETDKIWIIEWTNFQWNEKTIHPLIKKDLQYLRDEQIVTTVGQGKGTVYVIKQQAE